MKLIDRIKRAFKPERPQRRMVFRPQQSRGYDAAKTSRLLEDWMTSGTSSDAEIAPILERVRNRCRDLERNDDYVRRFLSEVEINVVGPAGTTLQMKVQDSPGRPDKAANQAIELSWYDWSKPKNASVTGKQSFKKLERIVSRRVVVDGEIFIRKVSGYLNEYGFALQLIEADYCDVNYHQQLPNGNIVRCGIEFDQWRKPVAYYFLTRHPGDVYAGYLPGRSQARRERIPAEEIIHYFFPERPEQTRGIPMFLSAVLRLRQLKGYEEAELVAARIAASKMGFFSHKDGEDYKGEDADGELTSTCEPGTFEDIGTHNFTPWDPSHPNGNYSMFRKGVLRGICAGFNVSYHKIGMDLEGASYSSLREGKLNENEVWMLWQSEHQDLMCDPVFEDFLKMALLSGRISIGQFVLPIAKFAKFNAATWIGRRWRWVDPEKEAKGYVLAIQNGLTSRRRVVAELGGDVEEIDAENAEDKARESELGLTYGTPSPAPVTEKEEKPEVDEEE